MEYNFEFLKGTRIENAYDLMDKFNFPTIIKNDFKEKNIVYMSLPNGSITTDLPDIVQKGIHEIEESSLVYHVIAGSITWSSYTCFIYNLMFAEDNIMILNNYVHIPCYSINIDIPNWSEVGNICVTRNSKGMKRTK